MTNVGRSTLITSVFALCALVALSGGMYSCGVRSLADDLDTSQASTREALDACAEAQDTAAMIAEERDGLSSEVASLTSECASLTTQLEAADARYSELETELARANASRTSASSASTVSRSRSTTGVEQWRPLVARYFPADAVDDALSVMAGESGGNPNARNGTCTGLFQLHAVHWQGRTIETFYGSGIRVPIDPTNPEHNVRIAADLYRASGWSHWSVKP